MYNGWCMLWEISITCEFTSERTSSTFFKVIDVLASFDCKETMTPDECSSVWLFESSAGWEFVYCSSSWICLFNLPMSCRTTCVNSWISTGRSSKSDFFLTTAEKSIRNLKEDNLENKNRSRIKWAYHLIWLIYDFQFNLIASLSSLITFCQSLQFGRCQIDITANNSSHASKISPFFP